LNNALVEAKHPFALSDINLSKLSKIQKCQRMDWVKNKAKRAKAGQANAVQHSSQCHVLFPRKNQKLQISYVVVSLHPENAKKGYVGRVMLSCGMVVQMINLPAPAMHRQPKKRTAPKIRLPSFESKC